MYSKPLASRMDGGPHEAPAKARRTHSTANFVSFMPQAANAPATLASQMPGQGQKASPLEQAATQGNLGLNQLRAMAALTAGAANTQGAVQEAGQEQGQGLPLNPRDLFKLLTRSNPDMESAEVAVRVKAHRKPDKPKERAAETVARKVTNALKELRQNSGEAVQAAAEPESVVGRLAAQFESGQEGIAAIGYDRHGGTSYGKYQISSRAGTMRNFIGFLRTEAPDIADKLEKAGPMNTGNRRGKMPDTWRQIAEEQPGRFEDLQDKFIRASHFEPAMRALEDKTGIAFNDMPAALHEVVFSTAVQHGPNATARIISRSLGQVGQNRLDPEKNDAAALAKAQENLIRKIYDNRSGQFQSSTERVQAAVKNRLRQEMSMAISMLRSERAGA